MGTLFRYTILGLVLLYACSIQAITFAPTGSIEEPIFTSSSSILHDSKKGSTLGRGAYRNGLQQSSYAPNGGFITSSFNGNAPSMTHISSASCSFKSGVPVVLAANDVEYTPMRRVGENDHLPDPMMPIGDIPYELFVILISAILIVRYKKTSTRQG